MLNYYELPGFSNLDDKIPVLLRISNILPNIDVRAVKKIVIFYDNENFDFVEEIGT